MHTIKVESGSDRWFEVGQNTDTLSYQSLIDIKLRQAKAAANELTEFCGMPFDCYYFPEQGGAMIAHIKRKGNREFWIVAAEFCIMNDEPVGPKKWKTGITIYNSVLMLRSKEHIALMYKRWLESGERIQNYYGVSEVGLMDNFQRDFIQPFPDLRLGLLSDKEQKVANKEIARSIFSHYGLIGSDDASKEVRGALCKDYIVDEKYGNYSIPIDSQEQMLSYSDIYKPYSSLTNHINGFEKRISPSKLVSRRKKYVGSSFYRSVMFPIINLPETLSKFFVESAKKREADKEFNKKWAEISSHNYIKK